MDISKLASKAIAAHKSQDFKEAERLYKIFLAKQPNHPVALHLLGALYQQVRRSTEAVALLKKAAELDAMNPDVHSNLAVARLAIQDFVGAIDSGLRAIELGGGDEAHFNLATAYRENGDFEKAKNVLNTAIEINLSTRNAVALAAIEMQENNFLNAETILSKILTKDPTSIAARDLRAFARRRLADWSNDLEDSILLIEECRNLTNPILPSPLFVLSLTDDPKAQLHAAQKRFSAFLPSIPPTIRRESQKINIAYMSPDFREHPVARLMKDVIIKHDTSKYNITIASFGPDDKSEIRKELKENTNWLELQNYTDDECNEILRRAGIDIIVDLAGHTDKARPGILASRAAPIQIAYLGYPGTTGARWIDYTIVDDFVVPADSEYGFSECLIRLPGCFQANSARPTPLEQSAAKANANLPSGIIFCNHSNLYKISSQQFRTWTSILKDVPNSFLWLTSDNKCASRNLRAAAEQEGIKAERILTRTVSSWNNYLQVLPAADIFLDTFPFNAGTVASDALWSGVPIVTLPGRSFASRMAGSLLNALKLNELIAKDEEDYKRIAVELAQDAKRQLSLRQQLAAARDNSELFDPSSFARKLEGAYSKAYASYRKGKRPRSFNVEPLA